MVFSIAFGKGGTGKTSTAWALANYARTQGKSVLCIDFDPQANFSYAMGGNSSAPGIFEILTGKTQAAKVIQHTAQVDLISAGRNLADAEMFISKKRTADADFILRDAIAPLRSRYDLIVIDTQPDLNTLLYNALCASDTVLLPMQANSFSIMGLYQIQDSINAINTIRAGRKLPPLPIAGILLVRYKPRQTLASELRESIVEQAQEMGTSVFNTYIREGVVIEQAQTLRQSLFDYAPASNPAKDYKALFEEMGL